jgi:hypothetical protein
MERSIAAARPSPAITLVTRCTRFIINSFSFPAASDHPFPGPPLKIVATHSYSFRWDRELDILSFYFCNWLSRRELGQGARRFAFCG